MQGRSAKMIGPRIFDDRGSIKAYVVNNNAAFNEKIAMTASKDYSRMRELGIFEHSNQPCPHTFYYHASKFQSDNRNEVEEFIIRELHHFYSNYQCSYAVAYMHDSFVDFIYFRRFVEKWPEHFFHRLRRIYIVGASLMVRFIETCSFGTFYRLCDQLFLNLPDDSSLRQADSAVMASIGESPTNASLNAFKDSIKIIQSDLYGKNLSEYELYTGKYPILVLRLLGRLVRRPDELRIQGIFRKSCDSEELEKLERRLEKKDWDAIDREEDTLVVCGCLKKIMNNLKLPLFNYGIYDRILAFSGGEQVPFIKGLLAEMEYVNHKVFVLLLVFLTDYIVHQKEVNKMNAYNLSVVFGPCFFRPQEYDLKDLINSGKFAKILINCFELQQKLIEPAERTLAQQILKALQEGKLQLD